MGCQSALDAYFTGRLTEKGKPELTFKRNESLTGFVAYQLPCGRCFGCRLERSRQWAIRCMHEKQMHLFSCFVTLTYDDEHMPPDGGLHKRDLQLFMKRLRKRFKFKVRFYACGEYGDTFGRPHYHLLLFGMYFADQRHHATTKAGHKLYRSKTLSELWPFGNHWIGDVTFESAAYVARYIMKKINGEGSADHYMGREPEFTVMSRRPGIGATWFDKYHSNVYEWDSVVVNGKEVSPPRFYDLRYELLDSVRLEQLKSERRRRALLNRYENTPDRRFVKQMVQRRKMAMFQQRE